MSMNRRRLSQIVLISVITAVLILSSVVWGASSDDSFEKIRAAGVIRIGVDDAFPPMEYRDEKGNLIGFDVDLANETRTTARRSISCGSPLHGTG